MALSAGFEKHTIIGGCVDSFCLVCNSHLRTYDEVIVHIKKPIHNKNLDSAPFNEKYKEDNILKVREGYFCMFCCILLSTIRKVALHVAEPQHISNKGLQLLKRFGAFITAYDEIFITNAAWGGIMNGSCAICDVEVTDEKRHETETVHVLNVIRSEVEFGEGRQIYRKVDDNSIYCITCNEMFSNDASKSHFNDLEHNNKLEACKIAYKMHKHGEENNNSIEPLKNSICTLGKEEIQNVDRISTSDDETVDVCYCRQIYGISSPDTSFKSRDNLEREENGRPHQQSAIASQDTDSDSDKQSTLALSNDINHVYANETVDTDNNTVSEITDEPIIFAKTNMLTYNKDNSNAYCRICEVKLPANIKSMKEHVSGKGHKKNVSNQTPLANTDGHGSASDTDERFIEKTPTNEFVNETFTIRTVLVTEEIINYKFCLEQHSFNMITRTGINLRCEMCDEYLAPEHVVYHVHRASHIRAVGLIPILTSLHKEFVREVRSGKYHCGFCNLVAVSWGQLQLHLACSEHREAKLKAEVRLMLHMPAIHRYKLQLRIQEEESSLLLRRIRFPYF